MHQRKVAVFVTAPASDLEKSKKALQMCLDVVHTQTLVDHVFFYFDAAYNAAPDAMFHEAWNQFSSDFSIPLIACSTLAENRGLHADAAGRFTFAGLSEFYSRLHHCHEVIQA
ncbi:hypothetical protein DRW07_07910 [Alteromonas sediminis]|uniref:Uncharacterized protein n=1 Tax=Alteromonas sediminis TaxID=2259342 RepID=A0A3N5Y3M1_9ALTE|nr:DsrE family protein [Alteromonas sediminis]RPJ67436.1 hypothetical protein DRW07_07910 [Alteromonas sediminis]